MRRKLGCQETFLEINHLFSTACTWTGSLLEMLHFETRAPQDDPNPIRLFVLRRIAGLPERFGQPQRNDFGLLGAVKETTWKKPIHQDTEPSKSQARNHRDSANNGCQQDHANDQIRHVVAAREIRVLVPCDLGVVIDLAEQLLRVTV